MGSYMPTLADYSKVSWIQSQSLALLYRWPKFLDKRKFGSVAHKKLSSICSKISKSSGFLCLYFVSGFIFLCDACCSFQTKRRKFLVCYSYIGESLIRWVFNKLKSLTDRSTFFLQNYLEGGSRGSKSKETFSGGGPHWRIRSGGCWSEKKSPDFRSPSLGMKSYHKQLTFWAENPSISWSSLVVHGFSWLVLSLFT